MTLTTETGSNTRPGLISICVPTFNRGQKALRLVNRVLPTLKPGCTLLVADNCSDVECDAYEEIARLAQASPDKLIYRRHPRNLGFHGNYLYCLREGRSDLVMLISDEDYPNVAILATALNLARNNPNIGIVRGGVAPPQDAANPRRNSFELRDATRPAGKAALTAFALFNNYFSGTIYNRALLLKTDFLERLERNAAVHRDYPHLYIEALLSAVSDIALCAEVSCFEGTSQMVAGSANPFLYAPPYTVGARTDQFIALRNALYEAVGLLGVPFDAKLFCDLYQKNCAKFFRLVARANARMYANNFIDAAVTVRAFAYFACAAFVRIPAIEPYREQMTQEIDKAAREYGG